MAPAMSLNVTKQPAMAGTHVCQGDTFHIAPVIQISGNASDVDMSDIRKIAKEVGRLIDEEARMRVARRH
jgi:hypothetical protein